MFLASSIVFASIWLKARKPIADSWCSEFAGHWDDAIRKSSALRAALGTAFLDETGDFHNLISATILWDVKKFYDSLNLQKLLEKSLKLGFNAVLLHQAVLLYI